MKTQSKLLILAFCSGLTAPVSAQMFGAQPSAAEPDPVPATEPAPAPAVDGAAADGDVVPVPPATQASEPMPTFEAAPAGDAGSAPVTAPAPEATPAPAPTVATVANPPAAGPRRPEPEGGEEGEPAEKPKCLAGDLCVGPVLALGVINALGVGAHARYGQYFGFGLDYQWVPQITFGDAAAGWSLITGEARWYPFGGAFWLGGGVAYQAFNAQVTGHMSGYDVILKGRLSMPAFKLGMGFMGHNGFVMGIDLDANIPLGGTHVSFSNPTGSGAMLVQSVDPNTVAKLRSDINSAANKGVKLIPVVPQLNLIRIGYLF